jgi:hypothetical protein
MFEIRCIVADKNVPVAIRLLDGFALEPPVAIPVREDSSPTPAGGGSVDLMRQFVKHHKKVTAKQLREHCESQGYSKNGYSYALQRLLKEGRLKRAKEPHTYEVVS